MTSDTTSEMHMFEFVSYMSSFYPEITHKKIAVSPLKTPSIYR